MPVLFTGALPYMKKLLVCIYFIAGNLHYAKASPDTLLTALAHAIEQAPVFDAAKIKTIESLKKSLYAVNNSSPEHAFTLAEQLYEEYKIFNYDSAYSFAGKMQALALSINNVQLINTAKLKYAFILLSAGLYRETLDTLKSVNVNACPVPEKAEYYTLMGRYYYDLATYEYDKYHSYNYDITAGHYMDTAISYYPGGSFEKNYYTGLKLFKEGRLSISATYFEKILANIALPAHEFALTASTLSGVYLQNGETDKAIGLLARAAIADIHTSTKETFAIYSLAELLYQKQDVKYASMCIENAIANASFYDARQRKAQVSGILSLIESERIRAIEAQRGLAIQYGIAVTVSLAALAVLIVIIRKQVKKLKRAQEIITKAHTAQQQMNEKLVEANKIKEEYIGYFFKLDSEYFGRLEKLKKTLELKLADRKFEDIRFIVNNIQPKRDKDELLRNFDKVFLRIFPHFVDSFNALFKEEDQVKLPQNDMLNVDLRIFALIRIGITDNEKIAEILEYSVNTIYSYKTRIKNKSLVSNDDFEKRIKEIKSV
jgi:hypothetical protein